MSQPTQKEPWLAVVYSSICPGVGHLYSGQRNRGIIFIIIALGCLYFAFSSLFNPEASIQSTFQFGGIFIALNLFCYFDSFRLAKKTNSSTFKAQREETKDPWLSIFLSQLIPGVGHFYQNRTVPGIIFLISIFVIRNISNESLSIPVLIASVTLSGFCFYHVARNIPNGRPVSNKQLKQVIIIFLCANLVSASLSLLLRNSIEARYIPSESMLPTFEVNDRLLIDKAIYKSTEPQRQDVIIFYPTQPVIDQGFSPRSPFISRLIAIPGDTVEVTAGQVFINGEALVENYILEAPDYEYPLTTLPANSYFILGDNRNNSYDSAYWGFVPRENIFGKATKIYWPMSRAGKIM